MDELKHAQYHLIVSFHLNINFTYEIGQKLHHKDSARTIHMKNDKYIYIACTPTEVNV